MKVVEMPEDVRELTEGVVGLVPTMGALHEGHLSLVTAARRRCDTVVASVFVNPLQFDRPSDLERYPRDLPRDAELAAAAGADVVFAPPLEVMYPRPSLTSIQVGEVASAMEGEHRPGHFAGVALVVAKLLAAIQPDVAFFGRKDHQQLVVVRQMAADLSLPVEVIGCPVVREPDGLALSSRNAFLLDRAPALTLNAGLVVAAAAVEDGVRAAGELEEAVRARLQVDSVDYVTLASQERARPLESLDRPAFLAVAGWVGDVRLIDNLPFDLVGEMFVPDHGVRLPEPSSLARR